MHPSVNHSGLKLHQLHIHAAMAVGGEKAGQRDALFMSAVR
jgi:hypothetical protein